MAPSILLVDPDANFRRTLRVALALEGVAVGEASSLAEAARLLDHGDWNCVVLDLLLPFAEGRQAVEALRARGVAIIACSAHPELLRAAAERMDVLEKPFSPATLLERACRLLARRSA